MLIVSADDWGYSARVTAAIQEAFEHGVISSTSAMVWQSDSTRAAELAREHHHPVGLHLNLTTPLRAADTPARVRDRHEALIDRFAKDGWRDPPRFRGDRQVLRDAVRDQLDRFREELGEPTHVDGHHHVHAHPDVQEVLLELLPADMPVRSVPSSPARPAGTRPPHEQQLRARFPAPDVTWELEHLLAGGGLDRTALAGTAVVEVVTHPVEDRDVLLGDAWRSAIRPFDLATYRELPPLPPAQV